MTQMSKAKLKGPELWRWPALIYAALLLSVYVVIVPSGGYTEFKGFKYVLFAALTAAFIAGEYLLRLEMRLVGAKVLAPKFGVNAFELCVLAYVLFTAISALLSEYSGTLFGNERRDGFVTIALYGALCVVLSRSLAPKKWLAMVFGAAMCVFCVLGLLQLYGLNPLSLFPEGYDFYDAGVYYSSQFWSTAGNADISAALLCISAGIFAALLIKTRAAWGYAPLVLTVFSISELNVSAAVLALFVGLAIALPVLVCSGAELRRAFAVYGAVAAAFALGRIIVFGRASLSLSFGTVWVALLCAGIILAAASLILRGRLDGAKLSAKKLRLILLCLVLAVFIFGLAFIYFAPDLGIEMLSQAQELLHGNVSDKAGSGRIFIWRQVGDCIKEKPIFGGGPDTLGQRGLEGFSRYNPAIGRVVSTSIDAAHNEYLNIWVNQGLLALLAYLALLGVSVVKWVRNPNDTVCAVCGAAALLYAIQAFFGISSCIVSPLFWLALAMVNRRDDEVK